MHTIAYLRNYASVFKINSLFYCVVKVIRWRKLPNFKRIWDFVYKYVEVMCRVGGCI